MNLNVDTVLELIWEYMGLLRIYTKKRAEPPSFDEPVVLSKYRNGLTVEGAVSQSSIMLLYGVQARNTVLNIVVWLIFWKMKM